MIWLLLESKHIFNSSLNRKILKYLVTLETDKQRLFEAFLPLTHNGLVILGSK